MDVELRDAGAQRRHAGAPLGLRHVERLREGLALDGMSFDPAARLTMLAVVTDDAPALALGLARAVAVAPLHPLTLGAQALQAARAGDKARAAALSKRALAGLEDAEGRGPADTLVVLAVASDAAGEHTTAKILATRAAGEKGLPEPAKQALTRITSAK